MQLAILHYHLNSGGVARVVQNHLLALAQAASSAEIERVLLLHGGRPLGWEERELNQKLPFDLDSIVIDGLDYDEHSTNSTEDLSHSIEAALRLLGCAPETTLLHWHNHALGKNVSAPIAVRSLARRGFRTLLQIHDFAEDFRPENYRRMASSLVGDDVAALAPKLYPQAEHIFYATLNRRDHEILSQAGINDDQLYVLPNPVSGPTFDPDKAHARKLVSDKLKLLAGERLATYPVRGIRRKNLGEMLLWSATVQESRFLVTLAPQNPAERTSFERWEKLADELGLACQFGVPDSLGLSFEQVQTASDVLLSTSVAEGFGMSFLESWLAGRSLVGRNLPEITADFEQVGLDLNDMYTEVLVPAEWINPDRFSEIMTSLVKETYQSFGVVPPEDIALQQELSSFLETSAVDFAHLPTKVQSDVIRSIQKNESHRERLLALNPKLGISEKGREELISANARVVNEYFSLAAIGKQLADIYNKLMKCQTQSELHSLPNGQAILDSFLRVDRLHAIRVEP